MMQHLLLMDAAAAAPAADLHEILKKALFLCLARHGDDGTAEKPPDITRANAHI
jgi:hypothetical protein